jgi:hypothetical protein
MECASRNHEKVRLERKGTCSAYRKPAAAKRPHSCRSFIAPCVAKNPYPTTKASSHESFCCCFSCCHPRRGSAFAVVVAFDIGGLTQPPKVRLQRKGTRSRVPKPAAAKRLPRAPIHAEASSHPMRGKEPISSHGTFCCCFSCCHPRRGSAFAVVVAFDIEGAPNHEKVRLERKGTRSRVPKTSRREAATALPKA